ncbi:MAG TPA: GNAT family protein [Ktedonobacterales bacterium]
MSTAPVIARDTSSQDEYLPPCLPDDALRQTHNLTLRDGSVVRVRAIRAEDTERLQAFHAHLSMDSIIWRFFRSVPSLSDEQARQFTHVDYRDRMALIATRGDGAAEEILAVVRYDRTAGAREAEVAFVVADAWQGHGLATALLHQLAAYGRAHGIERFVALTMGTNVRMLDVLHHCGFPCRTRYDGGDILATLDIIAPPRFLPGGSARDYSQAR